ncbi:hypothetical protein HDV00_004289 [Rhizophlyctis rosea]|nr:hypothetical protein HDV00_004289 [Rhizophlyctis rosea]
MLGQFIFTSLIVIGIWFAFRGAPEEAPSTSAAEEALPNVWTSLTELARMPSLWFLCLSFGINQGGFYALTTLLAQIILPLHPTKSNAISWLGFAIVAGGIVSALATGMVLDRSTKFKMMLVGVYGGTVVGYLAFGAEVQVEGSFGGLSAACTIIGLLSSSLIPASFQYASELFYPHSETITASILNTSAQVFGIIFIEVINAIMIANEEPNAVLQSVKIGTWVLVGVVVGGWGMCAGVKGRLKRLARDGKDKEVLKDGVVVEVVVGKSADLSPSEEGMGGSSA